MHPSEPGRALRLLALALATSCAAPAPPIDAQDAAASADAASSCDRFTSARDAGRIESVELDELSGLVASRASEGILYGHNDSGDAARVFALDLTGRTIAELRLSGVSNVDWEDIAISSDGAGRDVVWVADVGDNAAREGSGARARVQVHRFVAPPLDPSAPASAPIAIGAVETITLRYPDRAHDCEAVFVDPATGDLYLLSKEDAGASTIYRARAPLAAGEDRTLELLDSFDPGGSVTAADVWGAELVVRTYPGIRLYERRAGESWADALTRPGTALSRPFEVQGESIALAADGSAIFTASEGRSAILHRKDRCP